MICSEEEMELNVFQLLWLYFSIMAAEFLTWGNLQTAHRFNNFF